jgi:hypothetical protein
MGMMWPSGEGSKEELAGGGSIFRPAPACCEGCTNGALKNIKIKKN